MSNNRNGRRGLRQLPELKSGVKYKAEACLWSKCNGVFLAGVYTLMTINSFSNSGTVKLNINQVKLVGMDLINNIGATWTNNGLLHIQYNLTNNGTFDCGDCASGVTYFNNVSDLPQVIDGTAPIEMRDVVLETAGDLYLNTELRVTSSFLFLEGEVITDRANPGHFINFINGATYLGHSKTQFVDGYACIEGAGTMTLPIGSGSQYLPVDVEGATATSAFKAAFFRGNPTTATLPEGAGSIPQAWRQVESVLSSQYWDVDGVGVTPVR